MFGKGQCQWLTSFLLFSPTRSTFKDFNEHFPRAFNSMNTVAVAHPNCQCRTVSISLHCPVLQARRQVWAWLCKRTLMSRDTKHTADLMNDWQKPDKLTWQCFRILVWKRLNNLRVLTVSKNTISAVKNCAHQYFTQRRHWCCHASQQDLSTALWAGVWFPHTSLLTQGSLTVTYARGDRSVRRKICVSARISSVLVPWNLITSETVRNPWLWCYETFRTCRATAKNIFLRVCMATTKENIMYIMSCLYSAFVVDHLKKYRSGL